MTTITAKLADLLRSEHARMIRMHCPSVAATEHNGRMDAIAAALAEHDELLQTLTPGARENEDAESVAVLLIGNPVDGCRFVGPFPTEADAAAFASDEISRIRDAWTTASVVPVSQFNDHTW